MKNILIIGAGEIGTSLKEVEEESGNKVFMRDLDPSDWETNGTDIYDVCHVAIPYKNSEQFISAMQLHNLSYTADITIIHSTVEVGTTRKVIEATGNEMIVHSFVRGVHPYLAEGIKTFVKAVGAVDVEAYRRTTEHLHDIDVDYDPMQSPESSEMAKLLSTTYYAWNIFYAHFVDNICKEFDVPYNEVYTWANDTYNRGYEDLGRFDVIRPVLSPPKGKIGGHCLLPNIELLPEGPLKEYCKEISDKM